MGNACGRRKEIRLVLIGLDLAGKTSILNRLKYTEAGSTTPTVGFNFETISFKNIDFNIWDTGGQDKIRDLWKHYYEQVDGVLFVVDSKDEARLDEAKDALHRALHDINLKDAFLCVLANKRDLENCLSVETMKNRLQLSSFPETRVWALKEVSALKGTGLEDVLIWAAKQKKWRKYRWLVLLKCGEYPAKLQWRKTWVVNVAAATPANTWCDVLCAAVQAARPVVAVLCVDAQCWRVAETSTNTAKKDIFALPKSRASLCTCYWNSKLSWLPDNYLNF